MSSRGEISSPVWQRQAAGITRNTNAWKASAKSTRQKIHITTTNFHSCARQNSPDQAGLPDAVVSVVLYRTILGYRDEGRLRLGPSHSTPAAGDVIFRSRWHGVLFMPVLLDLCFDYRAIPGTMILASMRQSSTAVDCSMRCDVRRRLFDAMRCAFALLKFVGDDCTSVGRVDSSESLLTQNSWL